MQEELPNSGSADTTPGAELSQQQMGRGTGRVKRRAANTPDPIEPDILKFRVEKRLLSATGSPVPDAPRDQSPGLAPSPFPSAVPDPLSALAARRGSAGEGQTPPGLPGRVQQAKAVSASTWHCLPSFYSGSREAAEPCSEREADGARIQCGCAAHLFGTKMTDTRWNNPNTPGVSTQELSPSLIFLLLRVFLLIQ